MGKYQLEAQKKWNERGYKADIPTLLFGLCEEVGEAAKAYNFYMNPLYIPTPGRTPPDDLEHELRDCLFYIAHIANQLGVDLEI